MNQYNKIVAALKDLIDAAKAFLSDSVVVETTGTIPLLDGLDKAIGNAEVLLPQVESDTGEPVGRRVQ
jgi:hypothetical protein